MRDACARAEDAVAAFTGWTVDAGPTPEVLNRRDWVDANLRSLEPLLAVAETRLPLSSAAARAALRPAMSVQLGLLFGYLSRRVIAQFDLLGGERLLFVGPNIVETERRADVEPEAFRMWVALHEVTHRLQFGGVSWLRPALEEFLDRSLSLIAPHGRRPADLVRRLRASLAHASALPGLAEALLTEEQRALLREAQALMSAVEGHASFVMDRLGADVIPDVDRLRARVEGARGSTAGPERTLQRLIGLEAKRRQYVDGKRFFDTVADRHGLDAVEAAWASRDALPTVEELSAPEAWAARVLGTDRQ